MKTKMMAVLTAVLFVGAAAAAQEQPAKPQGHGFRHGGAHGGMMRGGAGMMMRNPRIEAEMALAKKAPEEFAALAKERQAVEEKMQALAKKNDIQLPETDFSRIAKLAAFKKKYEKELEEINAQMKTDPRGAMRRRMELLKKEGIDLGFGGMRGGHDMRRPAAPEAGPRENMRVKLEEQIKEKFPEEYAAYLKEKETDPNGAAQKLRALAQKLRASAAPQPEKK